jgi:phosphopantetheinyl transferase (holo-ACP synthase)
MPLELVGNDIVDLSDPQIDGHHRNERFLARVCAGSERLALSQARDAKRYLWSIFAAKEAAFKVAVKRLGPVPFSHRSFVVAQDLRSVCYRSQVWPLTIANGAEWVHALVGIAGRAVFRVERTERERASDMGRRLLCELGARAMACEPCELSVVRVRDAAFWDGLAPPALLRRGWPASADVSLTHDGRFVAAALITYRRLRPLAEG